MDVAQVVPDNVEAPVASEVPVGAAPVAPVDVAPVDVPVDVAVETTATCWTCRRP